MMSTNSMGAKLLLAAFLAVAPARLLASGLNIDFGWYVDPPSNTFGGAAGQPGTWNWITSVGIIPASLVDLSGTTTTISLNVAADSPSGGDVRSVTTDIGALRDSNFFSLPGDTWSFILSNLSNGTYSLYYYSAMHPSIGTGSFTVNGVSAPAIGPDPAPTLEEGIDWEVVSGIAVTDGTLTATSTDTSSMFGLAGMQLVEQDTPEPCTLLLGLATFGIVWRRRRRFGA